MTCQIYRVRACDSSAGLQHRVGRRSVRQRDHHHTSINRWVPSLPRLQDITTTPPQTGGYHHYQGYKISPPHLHQQVGTIIIKVTRYHHHTSTNRWVPSLSRLQEITTTPPPTGGYPHYQGHQRSPPHLHQQVGTFIMKVTRDHHHTSNKGGYPYYRWYKISHLHQQVGTLITKVTTYYQQVVHSLPRLQEITNTPPPTGGYPHYQGHQRSPPHLHQQVDSPCLHQQISTYRSPPHLKRNHLSTNTNTNTKYVNSSSFISREWFFQNVQCRDHLKKHLEQWINCSSFHDGIYSTNTAFEGLLEWTAINCSLFWSIYSRVMFTKRKWNLKSKYYLQPPVTGQYQHQYHCRIWFHPFFLTAIRHRSTLCRLQVNHASVAFCFTAPQLKVGISKLAPLHCSCSIIFNGIEVAGFLSFKKGSYPEDIASCSLRNLTIIIPKNVLI